MTPRDEGDHWTAGTGNVIAAAEEQASTANATLLHVSTPIRPLSARSPTSDDENRLMREAWELLLERLSTPVAGKRASWRSFLFVLPGDRHMLEENVRAAFEALRAHPELGELTWRFSAAELEPEWREVLRRVEDTANDPPGDAETSEVVWTTSNAS